MVNKPNCVVPRETGQGEKLHLSDGGKGRRKFLTTVAGAGAAVALLGSRTVRAQEQQGGFDNPFRGAGSKEEKTFGQGNAYKMIPKKTITKKAVEHLVENAKKERSFGAMDNPWGSYNGTSTKNFKHEVLKSEKEYRVTISGKGGAWEEEVSFPGIRRAWGTMMIFEPENQGLVDDEVLVFAGGGKIAVCFRDKLHGMPMLLEFRAGNGKGKYGMPNPGRDSTKEHQTIESVKIGYECKDGEITLISTPEQMAPGDKVLRVRINTEGEVSSSILEIAELNLGVSINPFG